MDEKNYVSCEKLRISCFITSHNFVVVKVQVI